MTNTNPRLAQALLEARRQVSYLQKKGENTAQGYGYTRAEDVLQAVNEALDPLGVSIVGSKAECTSFVLDPDPKGTKGAMVHVQVRIQQTYRHVDSGEEASFEGLGQGADRGDKATMKANTAAIKYLLTNMFNISWGDDPEAVDPETGKRVARSRAVEQEVLDIIQKAATMSELAAVKPRIQSLTGSEKARLIEAYKSAQAALESK